MKLRNTLTVLLVLYSIIFIQSCESEENGEMETKISSFNKTESHNIGENCMNCHTKGGKGEGLFTVAGTAYDSLKVNTFANATINLHTAPNGGGDIKYTLQGDAFGNFYTTEPIDFGSGLYAGASGSGSGDEQFMGTILSMGECNSCHGVTTNRIWVK